jgi:serine/threonine protein kinase
LDLSESAKELVMGMLEYDPKKRLTAKQVSKADPLSARTDLPSCAKGRRS